MPKDLDKLRKESLTEKGKKDIIAEFFMENDDKAYTRDELIKKFDFVINGMPLIDSKRRIGYRDYKGTRYYFYDG